MAGSEILFCFLLFYEKPSFAYVRPLNSLFSLSTCRVIKRTRLKNRVLFNFIGLPEILIAEIVLQQFASRYGTEFIDSLIFDLSDTFTGQAKLISYIFQ